MIELIHLGLVVLKAPLVFKSEIYFAFRSQNVGLGFVITFVDLTKGKEEGAKGVRRSSGCFEGILSAKTSLNALHSLGIYERMIVSYFL